MTHVMLCALMVESIAFVSCVYIIIYIYILCAYIYVGCMKRESGDVAQREPSVKRDKLPGFLPLIDPYKSGFPFLKNLILLEWAFPMMIIIYPPIAIWVDGCDGHNHTIKRLRFCARVHAMDVPQRSPITTWLAV